MRPYFIQEDYHREKRRHTTDQGSVSRLRGLRDTGQDDDPDEDLWDGEPLILPVSPQIHTKIIQR